MPTRLFLLAVAIGLFLVAGCGPAKINDERKYSMGPADSQVLDYPAIPKPQKITVNFSSSNGDVTVYILKDFTDSAGLEGPPPQKTIISSKTATSDTLTADVPANTATRVVLHGGKQSSEVTVKVTNSK